MNEVKNNFIRQINKSRRKTISVMNKINNNSEIGPVIYKDYLFKFQQLENTILILNEQLKDLDTIYNFEKNKTVIENKILDNNKFQSLKKSDIDILFPLFYCYYNKLRLENENDEYLSQSQFNSQINEFHNQNPSYTDLEEVD